MDKIDYKNDICIWFIEGQEIGHREHHFDWKEGDVITTDGKKTEIYAIVKNTIENVEVMNDMIHDCKMVFRGAERQKKFYHKELRSLVTNPEKPSKWFKGINIGEQDFQQILQDKYNEVNEKTFDKVFEIIDSYLEIVEK